MLMLIKINLIIKKAIATVGILGVIVGPSMVLTLPVLAADPSPTKESSTAADPSASSSAVCEGIGMAGGDCSGDSADTSITNLVTIIINIFSWVVGVTAVIMIIFAGFTFVTSGGGEGIKNAKNIMIYAVIGLIVVAFAQVIVHFAIGTATDAVKTPVSETR